MEEQHWSQTHRIKMLDAWTCICAQNDCHATPWGLFRNREGAEREGGTAGCGHTHFATQTVVVYDLSTAAVNLDGCLIFQKEEFITRSKCATPQEYFDQFDIKIVDLGPMRGTRIEGAELYEFSEEKP